MYEYGERIFISHRGNDYDKALELKNCLLSNKLCKSVILFPNESLCYNWEQLLVLEYFELMEPIIDYLCKCDSFLYLDSPYYWNGYFTQAEILQWRRFRENPKIHPVTVDETKFRIHDPIYLQPMSKNSKKLWAKISVNINPKLQGRGPVFWSKYARNCFLVGCVSCGEYFLITQKAMRIIISDNLRIKCPHCKSSDFYFKEDTSKKKNFYRYPIILKPECETIAELRTLTDSEILQLLVGDNIPESIVLIHAIDEKLKTDARKVGEMYGVLGLVVVAGLGIASFLSKDD